MNYSEKIYIIKEFVEKTFNFEVDLFSTNLPANVAGRTYYSSCRVELNCATAEEAFFTLLHEAGHVYSFDKYYRKMFQNQPSVEKREKYAYIYGWLINKILKLDVSKEQWRFQELENEDKFFPIDISNDPGFAGA